MGNGESKQETADFHHPVSPEILQAVIDTGGITDGSVIPLLKDLSPLDMRITLTIHKWRPLYTARAEAHQRTGKRRLKSQKNTLLKANEVLKFWIPWLSAYDEISKELLALISKGELLRIADWLSLWPPQKGRRDEFVLVGCAEDLAKFSYDQEDVNHPGRKSVKLSPSKFQGYTFLSPIGTIEEIGFATS